MWSWLAAALTPPRPPVAVAEVKPMPPPTRMKTSSAGLSALIGREAFPKNDPRRLKSYQDIVGVWTIGIGHTAAAGLPHPCAGMTLTEDSMAKLFATDIVQYENAVNDAVKIKLTQNEFDACVSLCFNIGGNGFAGSSVVRDLNAGNMAAAANAFLMWEKPPALKSRREAERAQFLKAA